MATNAALGCVAHSGWAAVVGATEVDGALGILIRERIILADPADPGQKQPYHTVEEFPLQQAAARLASYAATAAGMARDALERILTRQLGGFRFTGVGILDSEGRKGSTLASILASHALIHTADGDHYRDAIDAAARQFKLPVFRVRTRALDAAASEAIAKPAGLLHTTIKESGRTVGPPWGADQKAAALLAWLVLRRAGRD
jgi:hypothetical protein